MSLAIRGVKNTFRNKARTGAVLIVLAIVVGLTLSMLIANEAVANRLGGVRAKLDKTITASPAFSPGNADDVSMLTAEQLEQVRQLDHVESVSAHLGGMLETPAADGASNPGMRVRLGSPGGPKGKTDLASSVDPAQVGAPEGFAFPIPVNGTSGNVNANGDSFTIVEGRGFQDGDDLVAIVSDKVAAKNNLALGSTFTAFDQTFTVVGIAQTAREFDDVGVVMPISTLQRLGGQTGYGRFAVEVDDVDHLAAATDAVSELLGATVEVSSNSANALSATNGLETVKKITWLGFLICLLCAAVIVFFTLALTVRERRKEVGVLKAIGGTTRTVIAQFGVEATALVLLGTVLGVGVAALTSNLISDVLVSANTPVAQETPGMTGPGGGRVMMRRAGAEPEESVADIIGEVTAGLGVRTLGLGALAALGIAILGSALPAWLIARVRPAEVLRGE